jgi:hypothetical protein
VLLVAASSSAQSQALSPSVTLARIEGRVVDPGEKAAIGGAVIELRPGGRTATADAEGRFAFETVTPGRVRLLATLPGFSASPPLDIVVAAGASLVVRLEYPLRIAAEINVPASPPALTTAPVVAAGTTLDAREIARSPGGLEDVYRALQAAPGAAASQDDRNDVAVRGGGAIETATRVDGFDIPNPSHFGAQGGSGGGMSAISPWVIDRATLQPGAFSVQFGERASSVVDIVLRNGNRNRVSGQAGAGVGGAMALGEGPLFGGRGSWLVSVRRSFLELVLDRRSINVAPTYADAVAKMELILGARHDLELLALAGRDRADATSGGGRFEDRQQLGLGGISLRSQWTKSTSTAFVASFGTSDIDATDYAANRADAWDRSRERELRVRGEVKHRLGDRAEVVTGASIKQTFARFRLDDGAFRNTWGNVVPALRVDRRDQFTQAAGYAEITTRVVSALRVTAGVRGDRPATGPSFVVSPRAKLEYTLLPRVRLIGSWGVFRQDIPNIWLGSAPANRTLNPIESRQATAGVEVRPWRGMQAIVEAFDKRYRDYPVDPVAPARVLISAAMDFDSPFVTALSGGGRVHGKGIDVAIAQRVGSQLDMSATYSRWDVMQAGLDHVWRPADYDLHDQARIVAAWRPAPRWNFGASWRWADLRPYTPYDVSASIRAGSGRYDLTKINDSHYPPYSRLDVRTDCRVGIGRAILIFYAEVDNVYNRRNVFIYQWNGGTRSPDPAYQWGRMPIAGVRIEF